MAKVELGRKPSVATSVALDPDMKTRVDTVKLKLNQTRSYIVGLALDHAIKKIEADAERLLQREVA
jgi:predicted transcriptional regulator